MNDTLKMSAQLAAAHLSQEKYKKSPDAKGQSADAMGRQYAGIVVKAVVGKDAVDEFSALIQALGMSTQFTDGSVSLFSNSQLEVPFNNGRPFEREEAIISSDGAMNKAGLEFLLEAGVKNPVLEVAAKELGIEVDKSKGGWAARG
jgi:hypothetical protein